jgi:putative hemolysin
MRENLLTIEQLSRSAEKVGEPIVPPRDSRLLRHEVHQLPEEQRMAQGGPYLCFLATAQQIPNVLYEIGRLRELTFRIAGEGTGLSIDLDEFDTRYLHLFLWDAKADAVAGAYRLGLTDMLVPRFGPQGLYTSTLFDYDPELFDRLDPALELGRSFVRPEYQKTYSALLLLWKGIGRFVVKNPRYARLFGAVSISRVYDELSRQLLVAFLRVNSYAPELARFVAAKNPLPTRPISSWMSKVACLVGQDLKEVTSLLSYIEEGQREIPILLRQYLKLGGKLLGFNQDPLFGDVWDGLILVDLTQTNPRVLERYLGKQGARDFLAYQHLPLPRPIALGFGEVLRS